MGDTGTGRRRWGTRIALVVSFLVALLFAAASPALAHAEVESTVPVAGSVIPSSPALISLMFDEGVFPSREAIHVYDDHFASVAVGQTFHPDGVGKVVAAKLPQQLRRGTYTVTWRVNSDDGHVVSGQFAFSVGERTAVRLGGPPGTGHNEATSVVSAISRDLGYVGLICGPGALVVLAWLWPAGFGQRRLRRLLYGGGLLIVLSSAAAVWAQGAAASGVSLGHALNATDLKLGMAGHFGRAMAGRIVLLTALLWVATTGYRSRGRVPAVRVSLVALALAAMWPYAGHASAGDLVPLAFVADWVHVAAMASWLGGLALLLLGPLRRPHDSEAMPETFPMLAAFSEWALNAVTLLVATGLFAAWRNVRTIGALTGTHYGRLLLWKTGVVVVIVIVARLSRRHAEGLDRRAGAPLPVLRRTVFAEASGAAVVLAITAFLTGTAQAAQTYGPAFTRSAVHDGITVTVHVDRTHVGVAHLVVSTTRDGTLLPIDTIDGSISEPDSPIGPLPITFRPDGQGRELGTFTFPDAGEWSLMVDVETSSHIPIAVATTIRVRG